MNQVSGAEEDYFRNCEEGESDYQDDPLYDWYMGEDGNAYEATVATGDEESA